MSNIISEANSEILGEAAFELFQKQFSFLLGDVDITDMTKSELGEHTKTVVKNKPTQVTFIAALEKRLPAPPPVDPATGKVKLTIDQERERLKAAALQKAKELKKIKVEIYVENIPNSKDERDSFEAKHGVSHIRIVGNNAVGLTVLDEQRGLIQKNFLGRTDIERWPAE